MSDEEPVEQDLGDWELDGDDRGEVDRDEPVMEGSDEEFSDFEFDDPEGRVHWEKIYTEIIVSKGIYHKTDDSPPSLTEHLPPGSPERNIPAQGTSTTTKTNLQHNTMLI